ncbi:hypothetical protein [Bacteroides gallinarum]|uniref:hypothetical protein n=1 Tax=Bacteroides gallinarum TaxID=376806 RepID=UPI000362C779|nr:hypothetical protein [Bacteroides gallinarum]
MNDNFESDERKRGEIMECLYQSLMLGWDMPQDIRDHYGFTKDYQLFHQLESMEPGEYRQKRQKGEVPDILEIDARLTHRVEEVFERLCRRPPVPYLEMLNRELEKLGSLAINPKNIDGLFIHTHFLIKYGIDRNAPEDIRRKQAEDAYRKLDARFVKMTGRKPYADELFGTAKTELPVSGEIKPRGKARIVARPKPKGRKMGL